MEPAIILIRIKYVPNVGYIKSVHIGKMFPYGFFYSKINFEIKIENPKKKEKCYYT